MPANNNGNGQTRLVYVLDEGEGEGVDCSVHLARRRSGGRRDDEVYPISRVRQPEAHQSLTPIDRRILMRLYMAQSMNRQEVKLAGSQGHDILREMVGTKRCYWQSTQSKPLSWRKNRPAELTWQQVDEQCAQPVVKTSPPSRRFLPLTPAVYLDVKSGVCGSVDSRFPDPLMVEWLDAPGMSHEVAEEFVGRLVRAFPGHEIPAPLRVGTVEVHDTKPGLNLDFSWFSTQEIARVEFDYEGIKLDPNSAQTFVSVFTGGKIRKVFRNRPFEKAAIGRLVELGFEQQNELPGASLNSDRLRLRWKGASETEFEKAACQLQAEGWSLTKEQKNTIRLVGEDDWYTNLQPSEWNWFEFESGVVIDGQKVNLLPVIQHLLRDWRGLSLQKIRTRLFQAPVYLDLGRQQVLALPGRRLWLMVEKLFELFDDDPPVRDKRLRLDALRVAEVLDLESLGSEPWEASAEVRRFAQMLKEGVELIPRDPPSGFKTELRPYQKTGLAWLQFLREYTMHGILADDMGLGKTVQTLAHLLLEKTERRLGRPCLIVAPTSLMKNWIDEAKRFAPELTLLLLHGSDRKERFDRLESADVALTTYPLLRIDAERFLEHSFSHVILDEAQAIKNPVSQVAQVVCSLKAERRLCLTGTPLENHLGELWALFHFLMPGFLGSKASFNSRFRQPIEKLGLGDRQTFLTRRIAPFLLRRTKDQVEGDLPPKTEIVRTVELTEKQRDLYESVRLASDKRVREEIERKGLKRSHIIILAALLKLRQVCCDPRLLEKRKSKCKSGDSAKLNVLLELLPKLIEEGRKVLLFSQFTSMLSLIERELEAIKLPYVILTGSTRDRATPIETFQSGKVPLFLISLKAGGTGLNLTAADVVIHYDPWWNPAVENQATDRAHRIGQDKPVFVYKLLTEGTIEAKIQKMQEKKKHLVEGILSGSFKEKLTFMKEDLEILLAKMEVDS